jgi:GH15 family glucan-1,4-alpha-glucosidase
MGGLSPNTLAVAVDALKAASWLESKVGRSQTSERYGSKAREWTNRLKEWALIKNGKFGDGYFARMERGSGNRQWNPSVHETMGIANKGPDQQAYFNEDQILDGGFLQWILAGLVDPRDQDFSRTLGLYDQHITKLTSAGRGYLRYNEDAYGEFNRGGAWPLLSAERAIAGMERGENWQDHFAYVRNCKTKGDMLGEQDTLAVRPLGWSHASWLILEKSAEIGRSYYRGPYIGK